MPSAPAIAPGTPRPVPFGRVPARTRTRATQNAPARPPLPPTTPTSTTTPTTLPPSSTAPATPVPGASTGFHPPGAGSPADPSLRTTSSFRPPRPSCRRAATPATGSRPPTAHAPASTVPPADAGSTRHAPATPPSPAPAPGCARTRGCALPPRPVRSTSLCWSGATARVDASGHPPARASPPRGGPHTDTTASAAGIARTALFLPAPRSAPCTDPPRRPLRLQEANSGLNPGPSTGC